MHKAIDELISLVGDKQLIDNWAKKWILNVTHDQKVINKHQVSIDYHDYICRHVGINCLDKAMDEECLKIDIKSNSYNGTLTCFRQKEKKF